MAQLLLHYLSESEVITMTLLKTIDRNPDKAFDNAISHGRLCTIKECAGDIPFVGDFMFMYADKTCDYFKNIDTRNYLVIDRTQCYGE